MGRAEEPLALVNGLRIAPYPQSAENYIDINVILVPAIISHAVWLYPCHWSYANYRALAEGQNIRSALTRPHLPELAKLCFSWIDFNEESPNDIRCC